MSIDKHIKNKKKKGVLVLCNPKRVGGDRHTTTHPSNGHIARK